MRYRTRLRPIPLPCRPSSTSSRLSKRRIASECSRTRIKSAEPLSTPQVALPFLSLTPHALLRRRYERTKSNRRDRSIIDGAITTASAGNLEIITALVGAGADVGAVNDKGMTPLSVFHSLSKWSRLVARN